MASKDNILAGFYKVDQRGGSYVVATFFNPETMETETMCVRDYDYADGRNDRDDLYYMPINEEMRRVWLHSHGVILPGDLIEVYKGRKVKKGTIARVVEIKAVYDLYGRQVADYAYFEDGQRTNVDNCKLVEQG